MHVFTKSPGYTIAGRNLSSLVIRLIFLLPFTVHMPIGLPMHDSGISPFWFALFKLHNFLVNMSFVNAIGVCNKMVLTNFFYDWLRLSAQPRLRVHSYKFGCILFSFLVTGDHG